MKVNYKKTILVGLAFMAIMSFWGMYDNIIPLILKNKFHLNDVVIGAVMAMDNILALFMLPFFGILSDKTNSKWGRRIPYIIIGTFGAGLFALFLPIAAVRDNFTSFMVLLGLTIAAMNIFRTPAIALMPDVTPRLLRSRANAIINLMGAMGAMYALIVIRCHTNNADKTAYYAMVYAICGFMFICTVIMIFTIKENNWRADARLADRSLEKMGITFEAADSVDKLDKDKKRSLLFLLLSVAMWYMAYNGVTTVFSRYISNVWEDTGTVYTSYIMIATVAAILTYIPNSLLAARIGRKKTIMIGIASLIAGYAVLGFLRSESVIAIIAFVIIGIGWGAINVNSYPMVVEIAADGAEGKFTGYYYILAMAGQVITPVLTGLMIQYISYRLLFPYAMLFSVLAMITMSQVKHGDIVNLR